MLFQEWVIKTLKLINERTEKMDAVVTTLVADVATLKTQVTAVLAKIGVPALPADDAAAIAQANTDIGNLNTQLAVALSPGTVTGTTGTATPPATPSA